MPKFEPSKNDADIGKNKFTSLAEDTGSNKSLMHRTLSKRDEQTSLEGKIMKEDSKNAGEYTPTGAFTEFAM